MRSLAALAAVAITAAALPMAGCAIDQRKDLLKDYPPRIGTSMEVVWHAYGPPTSVDVHVFDGARVEHWVYDHVGGGGIGRGTHRFHLRFTNGALESIHSYPK